MAAPKTAEKDKQPDFEKSLERLETIVQEMETGGLSLEKMMRHFEEGMRLVKFCSAKLNEVERKIEILVKQDGTTRRELFEPPVEPAGAASNLDAPEEKQE